MKSNKDEEETSGTPAIPQSTTRLDEFHERFLLLIELWAADKYRYEWLEKHTGIPIVRWQNVLLDKQFPTLEMVLVVCEALPDYTYWLTHGGKQKPKSISDKYPDQEFTNKFIADREWIKEKRRSKAEKKSAKEGDVKIKQTISGHSHHIAGRDYREKK